MTMNVHIIGGGIGGMSCALHLGRIRASGDLPADSKIILYEASKRLGGKAASQIGAIRSQPESSADWPGEHGFRFFPNFYRCIVDTMKEMPIDDAHRARRHLRPAPATAREAMVEAKQSTIALRGTRHVIERSDSLAKLPQALRTLGDAFDFPGKDLLALGMRLTRFLLSCERRSIDEWDHKTLDDLISDLSLSDETASFLRSLRALSAMRADEGSLRTILATSLQMVADFDSAYGLWDAVLPGPTDWLMIEPWEAQLRNLGVDIQFDKKLKSLEFEGDALQALTFEGEEPVVATSGDVFVLAVPFERAKPILLAAKDLPKALEGVRSIEQSPDNLGPGAEPMVGVQFFLREALPYDERGHTMYPETPWAMTSIAQDRFWHDTFDQPISDVFGVTAMNGLLSAIVSAWDVRGSHGRSPSQSSEEEIAKEAYRQMMGALGLQKDDAFDFDTNVIGYHVDRDIDFQRSGHAFCTTPLWSSPKGSYLSRPLPDSGLSNFFLASDWARTATDVGSMESADEAARLAVQGIARRWRVTSDAVPEVRPLRVWKAVELLRAVDQRLYDHGLPHVLEIKSELRALFPEVFLSMPDAARAALITMANAYQGTGTFDAWASQLQEKDGHAEQVGMVFDALDAADWKGDTAADLAGWMRLLEELGSLG